MESPGALGGATGAEWLTNAEGRASNTAEAAEEQPSLFALFADVVEAATVLDPAVVAILCRALPRAIRRARGEPADLDAPRALPPLWSPDELKGREDWIDDLVRAWRHLDATDRAAFVARVTSDERRAA